MSSCRNGSICTLKRGSSAAKTLINLDSLTVGLVRQEKTIVVASMDEKLSCISTKGKLLWQQKMPTGILAIQPLDIASRGGQFIAVSLSNGKVLIFEDKHVVDWVRNMALSYSI